METIDNEIVDLVERKSDPSGRNVFWSLFALMSTREILPVRCGEQQGDWLCVKCRVSIVSQGEWIKKDRHVLEWLGLTFRHFDRDKNHNRRGYHWKKRYADKKRWRPVRPDETGDLTV